MKPFFHSNTPLSFMASEIQDITRKVVDHLEEAKDKLLQTVLMAYLGRMPTEVEILAYGQIVLSPLKTQWSAWDGISTLVWDGVPLVQWHVEEFALKYEVLIPTETHAEEGDL